MGENGRLTLPIAGRAGVPAIPVSSVLLNLTVTEPTAAGHVTVWPAGATRPLASNVNFGPNQTVANAWWPRSAPQGQYIYDPQGGTHVVVDVQGWFED